MKPEVTIKQASDNRSELESFERALSYGIQIQRDFDACDEIIKDNPQDEKSRYKKGIILYEMGYYDEAIKCFNALLKINPKYQSAYYAKGNVLRALGRLDEAEKAFAEQRQCWQYKPKRRTCNDHCFSICKSTALSTLL
jgi:tetratricopeptide (TPR) repeat protein